MGKLKIIIGQQPPIESEYGFEKIKVYATTIKKQKDTKLGKYKKYLIVPRVVVHATMIVDKLKDSFFTSPQSVFQDNNRTMWVYCGSGKFISTGGPEIGFSSEITELFLIASAYSEATKS